MKKRIPIAIMMTVMVMAVSPTVAQATGDVKRLGVRGEITSIETKVDKPNAQLTTGLIFPLLREGEVVQPKEQPKTVKDFEQVFLYMGANDLYEYTINYTSTSFNDLKVIVESTLNQAYDITFARYPEYFSFTNQLKTNLKGTSASSTLTFTLGAENLTKEQLSGMRKKAMNKADSVLEQFVTDGSIKSNMSETEKARVVYDWVINNTTYNESLGRETASAYGSLVVGESLCHGYTGAYNILAKKLGLNVVGVTGTTKDRETGSLVEHTWNVVTLDGKKSYIDTTWGDSNAAEVNYKYFTISEEELKKTHTWVAE